MQRLSKGPMSLPTCLLHLLQTCSCRAEPTRLWETIHCAMVHGSSAPTTLPDPRLSGPLHNRERRPREASRDTHRRSPASIRPVHHTALHGDEEHQAAAAPSPGLARTGRAPALSRHHPRLFRHALMASCATNARVFVWDCVWFQKICDLICHRRCADKSERYQQGR